MENIGVDKLIGPIEVCALAFSKVNPFYKIFLIKYLVLCLKY